MSGIRIPPTGWVGLTTVEQTPLYVRKDALIAYGLAPTGYEGNCWIILTGTNTTRYVLETMDQLTAMLQ